MKTGASHKGYLTTFSLARVDLFLELKSRVKGYHFLTHDSVQKNVTDANKTLLEADF